MTPLKDPGEIKEAHNKDLVLLGTEPPKWTIRGGDGHHTCSYCGSMHPEEVANLIALDKIRLGGSDWKYGHPHKFYVETVDGRHLGKFYVKHLIDHVSACDMVWEATGIQYYIEPGSGRLKYSAPFSGYQAGFHAHPITGKGHNERRAEIEEARKKK